LKKQYETIDLKPLMMGPNALRMVKELTAKLNLRPGMRIMDLGCGQGITSLFLAEEYKVTVFAVDLWIPATENYRRFLQWGIDSQIIPIHADANALPFADGYFDAVVSVDSYHYFGREADYLEKKLAPLVKPDGVIALAFPGLKREMERPSPAMLLSWDEEAMKTIRSGQWWREYLSKAQNTSVLEVSELACCDQAWRDWLVCEENPYARGDRSAMEAGAGKDMNLLAAVLKRK